MGELSGWRGLGGRGVAVGSLAASAVIVAAGAVARGPAHPARPAPPTQDRVVASLASGRRPALEPAGPRRAGTRAVSVRPRAGVRASLISPPDETTQRNCALTTCRPHGVTRELPIRRPRRG